MEPCRPGVPGLQLITRPYGLPPVPWIPASPGYIACDRTTVL
jgi:hypothetical protein